MIALVLALSQTVLRLARCCGRLRTRGILCSALGQPVRWLPCVWLIDRLLPARRLYWFLVCSGNFYPGRWQSVAIDASEYCTDVESFNIQRRGYAGHQLSHAALRGLRGFWVWTAMVF